MKNLAREAGGNVSEESYLTCGEFAALCEVKKQTLFHYDDIGLLKPEIVNDKGYRFYSYRQYETFAVIASLKEAGMSLSQIKDYLNDADSASRLSAMRDAQEKVGRKIEHLQLIYDGIDEEIYRAEEADKLYTDRIDLLDLPALDLIRSRDLSTLGDQELIHEVRGFASTFEVACAVIDMHTGEKVVWDDYVFLLAYRPLVDDAALARLRRGGAMFSEYRREPGTFAIAYHRGPFDTAEATYDRALDYCLSQGLTLGRYAYEEYLRNELTASREEDYLTRLCIPVSIR